MDFFSTINVLCILASKPIGREQIRPPIQIKGTFMNPLEITNAINDFKKVAVLAGYKLSDANLTFQYLKAPHTPPASLPKSRFAVYIFFWNDQCLKVGKVGPKSQARYTSQHYNPNSSKSNLAKTLLAHKNELTLPFLKDQIVGNWIRTNTDRVNILIDSSYGLFLLSLMESFFQCRFKPIFEGFESQKD